MTQDLYLEFEKIALGLIAEGRTHYSSDGILHVVRFNTRAHGDEGAYKVNNNLAADFARRFMREHPAHGQFFHLRRSHADLVPLKFDASGQASFA